MLTKLSAHAFSSRDSHDMQLLPLRVRSVLSPSVAFTTFMAAGGRGVLRSIASCSRRLTILLPFVALALCPEEASAQMPIYVRNLTPGGSTVFLSVLPQSGINAVRFMIFDEFRYSPSRQYLFYGGHLLQDGRSLSDYNIQGESFIDMAVIDSLNALSFSGDLPGSRGFSPFLMRSGTSGAGNGWSVFNYTNAVDLSATGSGAYTLDLFTLASYDGLGAMPDFDGRQAYDWTFLTATGGISGFSPDQFAINTARFANTVNGSFSVVQQGSNLALSYTPVPEPSTLVLVMTGLAFCGVHTIRRRS